MAAILILTGYKLANIALFKSMYKKGLSQFVPFLVTILAIVFTDLLIGVIIGLFVSIFYILKSNFKNQFVLQNEVLHFNDTLSLFKEAVETHLGDINISCDNADVQRCLERIRGHQAPRTRSSPRRCPPSSPTGVKGFANESSHQHTSKTD